VVVSTQYETVIGIEVHAQLRTDSKMFCSCPTAPAEGAADEPNTRVCPICLGMPGTLPVINRRAVELVMLTGLALGCHVETDAVRFERKNYFYPDLPKGYQISQYELPIVARGHMDIVLDDGTKKRIGITRAHLEEDAGKSLHEGLGKLSGIDLNRAGTPLIEIVSEPDMRSAKEAVAYLKKVHTLVRYLEICDGNMQEGSFRCDANVSVRRVGAEKFGTRAEIKNINSFRFVEKAINYEVARQIDVLEGGGKVVQETRLYDPDKGETRSMRSKEEANDYRYFPDPDLLPVDLDAAFIAGVRATLPELPDQKAARFVATLGLSEYDAGVLTSSKELAAYYEEVARLLAGSGEPSREQAKLAANWVAGSLAAALNEHNLEITESRIDAGKLAGLLQRIVDNTISGKIAKDVFDAMWAGEGDPDAIIDKRGLRQISDEGAVEKIVDDAIAANPAIVAEYKAGKEKAFNSLVGKVMAASRGKANPSQVNSILKRKLG